MNNRFFRHLKTTLLLIGGGFAALCALASCDSFLRGGDAKQQIDDVIAYNNAPSVRVYLKSDAELGEFLFDGEQSFKLGYDNLVQFSLNQDSYVFEKLEAVARTSPETSRNNSVKFTTVESDAKKGIYKINVKVLEQVSDIMIRPVCKALPKITGITPALDVTGCLQDSEITISFNKKMDTESFKDENGKIKGITITTSDGEDLSAYFDEAIFDSDNKSLNILPLCLIDDTKYLLPPDGTKNNLNIEVSYTFITVKDADGLEFTENGTHSYKINKNFSDQESVTVVVQNPVAAYGSFLSSGEKICIVRFGFDIEFTLNKEAYIFQGFEAVSQNKVLDESFVSFENRQYDDETGIYRARVRVHKSASDIIIRPKCQLITNADVTITQSEKGTDTISPAHGTKVQSFIKHEYSITISPDEDYEFIRWELYDIKTNAAITNGTYVTITESAAASTTYKVTQIPEDDIELGLRPIVVERPQIISYTPQNGGILKDSSIQILFDHDMDKESIYYTKSEVIALRESGIEDSSFLPPLKEEEISGNLENHYGYTKDGKTCYKNISLTDNKTGENLNDKFEAPFFENARTLSIPASKKDGRTLDDYTQVLVTVEKGFFYNETVYEQKKKPVTLRGIKKWTYQVTNHGDEDGLVFQKKNKKDLFTLKLESTDSDKLADETAHPTIKSDEINKLNFLKIKENKPTLYCDMALTDNNGSGPDSSFTINYERIKESDYIKDGTGEKVTGSFTRNYKTTTSQDAVYKGDLDLELPADGVYRIWFDFADRSDNHFIYPDEADKNDSKKGFYVVKDEGINMADPIVTDTSVKDNISLNLAWEPSVDWISTKIRYKKNTETDWSEYEEFHTRTTKNRLYSNLDLSNYYDFELINTDYLGNSQTVELKEIQASDLKLMIDGEPDKTVYLIDDEFDNSGLTMTASLASGASWDVDIASQSHNFTSSEICWQGKTVTYTYEFDGVTRSADVNALYYVANKDAITQTPVKLNNYDGTKGTDGTYYKFGDYPQTLKDFSIEIGGKTKFKGWCVGSDGYFYEKCKADLATTSSYNKCWNGVTLSQDHEFVFKVEPIKWRVLNPTGTGNKILFAENALTGNKPYFFGNRRTINGAIIERNNYKYSNIRAWLNGKHESGDTENENYDNNGFLQKAFTASAQDLIKETTVDNSVSSTVRTSNEYCCENTVDKIFLLSRQEAMNKDYGFPLDTACGTYDNPKNSRIRMTTDYARANGAYHDPGYYDIFGSRWLLRSPKYDNDKYVSTVDDDGGMEERYDYTMVHYRTPGIVPALSLSSADLPQ